MNNFVKTSTIYRYLFPLLFIFINYKLLLHPNLSVHTTKVVPSLFTMLAYFLMSDCSPVLCTALCVLVSTAAVQPSTNSTQSSTLSQYSKRWPSTAPNI